MSDPITTFDFEFGLRNGEQLFVSAVEGRDTIAMDDARVRIEAHPDADTVEETIVNRQDVAYTRFTKRTVQPDPDFESDVLAKVGTLA